MLGSSHTRNRAERMFGFIKNQRRDKIALSFASFLNIAAARPWLKFYIERT
jgi:hypothetical protein